MPGNGTIKLSELFRQLEINEKVADVENVTFTDDSLLEIKPDWHLGFIGSYDWTIKSLKAFNTEETLTIYMKDGKVIEIEVRDDQENSNLYDFLVNASISGATQSGNGYIVEQGKTYDIALTFKESVNNQFANTSILTYDIPDGLIIPANATSNITISVVSSGKTYDVPATVSVTTDGKLTVKFDETSEYYPKLASATNVAFRPVIQAQFDGTETHIKFSDTVEREVVIDKHEPTPDVSVTKTASYDEKSGKFTYTIKVKATGGSATNVNVKDIISGNALKNISAINVSGNSSNPIKNSESNTGFDYTFPRMTDGEEITLTYTADVDFSKDTDGDAVITADQTKNAAFVSSDHTPEHGSDYSHQINYSSIKKNDATAIEKEGSTTKLKWSVEVNPEAIVSMNGSSFTDSIDSKGFPMTFSGLGPVIKVYDVNGGLVDTRTPTWTSLGVTSDSTGYTYSFTDTEPYRYVFEYTTDVDTSSATTDVQVNNTATYKYGSDSSHGDIPTDENNKLSIDKSVESFTSKEVTWKAIIHVPPVGLDSAVVTDTLPSYYLSSKNEYVYDTYIANSLEVEGTLPGETYTVDSSDPSKVIITFFKNNQSGLMSSTAGHDIIVTLKTNVNEDWVKDAADRIAADPNNTWTETHKNTIDINGDPKDEAQVVIGTADIEKYLGQGSYGHPNKKRTITLDGKERTVFEYNLLLKNVYDDHVQVVDTFDTSILELLDSSIEVDNSNDKNMTIYGGNQYAQNQNDNGHPSSTSVNVTDTATGALFNCDSLPKDKNGVQYSYYRICYYLLLKEGVDLEDLAANNGGKYTIKNTAVWGEHEDTVEYETEYNPLKKELIGETTSQDAYATFRITFNDKKATLNNGDDMPMEDLLGKMLSLDYSSVSIQTDPEGISVPYTISGQGDKTKISFTVPDATKVVVTYRALVVGTGTVKIHNDVDVLERYHDEIDKDQTVHVGGEGSASTYKMTVAKVDGYDANKKLAGVKFKLTCADKTALPDDKEIYLITDNNGVIVIDGDESSPNYLGTHLFGGVQYILTEIEEPEGYTKLGNSYYFTFVDEMEKVDYSPGVWQYFATDSMQIKNWPLEGLIIEKQVESSEDSDFEKKFKFKITLSDEVEGQEQTDPANGIVSGSNVNGEYGDAVFKNGVAEVELKHNQQISIYGLPVPAGTKYTVEEIDTDGFDVSVNDGETTADNTKSYSGVIDHDDYTKLIYTNKKESKKGSLKLKKISNYSGDDASNKKYKIAVKNSDGLYMNLDGSTSEEPVWIEFANGDERNWEDIPIGVYTICEDEESAQITDYKWIWDVVGTGDVTVEGKDITVGENQTSEATVNNLYTSTKTSLTVKKVWSDQADHSDDTVTVKLVKKYGMRTDSMDITVDASSFIDEFNGDVASPDNSDAINVEITGGSETIRRTLNGADGWCYTFSDLPKEKLKSSDPTDYEPIKYKVSYKTNESGTIKGISHNNEISSETSGNVDEIDSTTTIKLTSTVPYHEKEKSVPVKLTWDTGGKSLPDDATVTLSIDNTQYTYNASAFEKTDNKYMMETSISLTDGKSYQATLNWSGTGCTSDSSLLNITVPQRNTDPIPTIEGTGYISLITVKVNVNPTWLKGENGKTTNDLPDGGKLTVAFTGTNKKIVLEGPEWESEKTIDLPVGTYTASVTVSDDNSGEITGASIIPDTDFNTDIELSVQGKVKDGNKVILSFENGEHYNQGMYLDSLINVDDSGNQKNGTDKIKWEEANGQDRVSNITLPTENTFTANGLIAGERYKISLGEYKTGIYDVEGGTLNYGAAYFVAAEGTTNVKIVFDRQNNNDPVRIYSNGTNNAFLKSSSNITSPGETVKITLSSNYIGDGYKYRIGDSGEEKIIPSYGTVNIQEVVPDDGLNIYISKENGDDNWAQYNPLPVSVKFEKVSSVGYKEKEHSYLTAGIQHVSSSTLTSSNRNASIFKLFSVSAYADRVIEKIDEPVDYTEISTLPDNQDVEVILNKDKNGIWSYTWRNLDTTEVIDDVEREVYYYVVETNVPETVSKIKYENSAVDEDRVTEITITNTKEQKGSLKLSKYVTVDDRSNDTSILTDGTYEFSIEGLSNSSTAGITHTVKITFANGKAVNYQIDSELPVNIPEESATGNSWSVKVDDLTPGIYTITETNSHNLTLKSITGGNDDGNTDSKKVTATVVAGDINAANNTAQVEFTNNIETTSITVKKAWSDKDTVNHDNDKITFVLYQVAADKDNVIRKEGVYSENYTDEITGSGSITIDNLPKTGEVDGIPVTYGYYVVESEGKEGYIQVVSHDESGSDNDWTITNIGPDDQNKDTSLSVTKVWRDKDNHDAEEAHSNDVITFKLIQRAVVSNYIPVTVKLVDAYGNTNATEVYYIQKGGSFTLNTTKQDTVYKHAVRVTTDRSTSDSSTWSTWDAGTHPFNFTNITKALTINAQLTFSRSGHLILNGYDRWGSGTTASDWTWGHSVAGTALERSVSSIISSVKDYETQATQDYVFTLRKDSLTDGSFDKSANGWTGTISKLPLFWKISDGIYYAYYYTIDEITVNGVLVTDKAEDNDGNIISGQTDDFDVTIDQVSFTITNTEREKTTASATKTWLNADNTAIPPAKATVVFELFADNKPTGKTVVLDGKTIADDKAAIDADVTLSDEEKTSRKIALDSATEGELTTAWKAEWVNLPKKNSQGEDILYTVKEITTYPGYVPETDKVSSGGIIRNIQTAVDINLIKVDKDSKKVLSGATFRLQKYKSDTYKDKEGEAVEVSVGTNGDQKGKLKFEALTEGYYEIEEYVSPEGYVKVSENPRFEVRMDNTTKQLIVMFTESDDHMVTYASETKTFTVNNEPGKELPQTGGLGTKLLYTLGSILVFLSGAILLIRRRRLTPVRVRNYDSYHDYRGSDKLDDYSNYTSQGSDRSMKGGGGLI